jgi:hypothetical protein
MRSYLALFFVASLCGCAQTNAVRYVYQDHDFGVLGMPENTDRWPTHYRRKAEKMMSAHFAEGHEIVRAEEVIEGERTVKIEGANSAAISPQVGTSVIKVVKLGHSATRTQADIVKVKECRIIYRRVGCGQANDASSPASLTPTWYVDPNAAERRKATEAPREKAKPQGIHESAENAVKPVAKAG